MRKRYAEKTTVSVAETQTEIGRMLQNHGAATRAVGVDDEAGMAVILFELDHRKVRIEVLSCGAHPADFRITDVNFWRSMEGAFVRAILSSPPPWTAAASATTAFASTSSSSTSTSSSGTSSGTGGAGDGGANSAAPYRTDDDSCGCRAVGTKTSPSAGWLLLAALLGIGHPRRRRAAGAAR